MLQKIKSYITEHKLFNKSDQLALAISGGKDSVCAAHILNQLEQPFVLVHVNFQLRGEESNSDQQFVSELAAKLEYCKVLYVKKVDTLAFQKKYKLSTQEAARQLRYDYFDELYNNGSFSRLITAHHGTDNLETFFINLYRTSGIQGLRGIPNKRSYIIRPFLVLSGKEIKDCLNENKLAYREDSSNTDTKYLRNTIRNVVTPAIFQALPDFEERALKSMNYLSEEAELLEFLVHQLAQKWEQKDTSSGEIKIAKSAILSYPQSHVILCRILDKYGFNPSQCLQILDENTLIGALFYSETHELLVDREAYLVRSKLTDEGVGVLIPQVGTYSLDPFTFSIEKTSELTFTDNTNIETVGIDLGLFPLTLRYWQEGDRLQPLGMTGSKLLSDFFIDEKVNSFSKHSTPLLCKGSEVLWVCGMRISEKLRATPEGDTYTIEIE